MSDQVTVEDLQKLTPVGFESLCKRVFESLGYEVQLTKHSGDEGVDLVLRKPGEAGRSIAQCKKYAGTVGPAIVREFYGTMKHEEAARGYVITTGTFSLSAVSWAMGKGIVLVDGPELVSLMAEETGLTDGLASDTAHVADHQGFWELVRDMPGSPLKVLIEGVPPRGQQDFAGLAAGVAQFLRANLSDTLSMAQRRFNEWRCARCTHRPLAPWYFGSAVARCAFCGGCAHSWSDECPHPRVFWSNQRDGFCCRDCGALTYVEKRDGLFGWKDAESRERHGLLRDVTESWETDVAVLEVDGKRLRSRTRPKEGHTRYCGGCGAVGEDLQLKHTERFLHVVLVDEIDNLGRKAQEELIVELDSSHWDGVVIVTTWQKSLRERLRRGFDVVFRSDEVPWSPTVT